MSNTRQVLEKAFLINFKNAMQKFLESSLQYPHANVKLAQCVLFLLPNIVDWLQALLH